VSDSTQWVFDPDFDNMTVAELREVLSNLNLTLNEEIISSLSEGLRKHFKPVNMQAQNLKGGLPNEPISIENLIKDFNTIGK